MGIWAEGKLWNSPRAKTQGKYPHWVQGLHGRDGQLLEDGWDFHTWRWVGKALGKVCQNIGM